MTTGGPKVNWLGEVATTAAVVTVIEPVPVPVAGGTAVNSVSPAHTSADATPPNSTVQGEVKPVPVSVTTYAGRPFGRVGTGTGPQLGLLDFSCHQILRQDKPLGSTAGCGKPHVRGVGGWPWRNPGHPTRSNSHPGLDR